MRTLVRTFATLSLLAAGAVAGCIGDDAPKAGVDGSDAGPDHGDGAVDPKTVAITPSEVRIGVLRPQTFTSTDDVVWSVEEGESGGRIDAHGAYASPATPGVYHVVATSKIDPSARTRATVTVAPLAASILVGRASGAGTLDGPTSRARFMGAAGVAYLEGSDTIIVADSESHTIRKIVGNAVTTVAGSPVEPGTADGIGNAARFKSPTHVAAADNGKRVWVLDRGNSCIRKIDIDTGAVTTFVGTCGTSGHQDSTDDTGTTALLGSVDAMILGASKDALYVCEINSTGFRGIRRIDAVTGKTTSPIPGLNNGCSMAANYFTKEVYFNANSNEKAVLKFADPSGGPSIPVTLTPVCPSMPVGSFTSMTIDSGYGGANDLYGADISAIYRCKLGTNTWSPEPFSGKKGEEWIADGPLADARFVRAKLHAFSPMSMVFVADGTVVRGLYPTKGTVETLAGLPRNILPVDGPRATARLTSPYAIVLDEAGDVIIADTTTSSRGYNNTLRRFGIATSSLAHLSGKPSVGSLSVAPLDGAKDDATFGGPWGMARVGDEVFVVDGIGQAIRRVRLATGAVTTLAGELGTTGRSDGTGPYAHFKFFDPSTYRIGGGITTDGTNLYVADTGNFAIRKIVISTGEVTTLAGGTLGSENGVGVEAQFIEPTDLAFVDGVLYVADRGDQTIRRVDVATGKVSAFVGLSTQEGTVDGEGTDARLAGPEHVVADAIGNLYFSESARGGKNVLRRIDVATKRVSTFAGVRNQQGFVAGPLPTTLGCPSGLAVQPNGDLLVADSCDGIVSVIHVVDP